MGGSKHDKIQVDFLYAYVYKIYTTNTLASLRNDFPVDGCKATVCTSHKMGLFSVLIHIKTRTNLQWWEAEISFSTFHCIIPLKLPNGELLSGPQ